MGCFGISRFALNPHVLSWTKKETQVLSGEQQFLQEKARWEWRGGWHCINAHPGSEAQRYPCRAQPEFLRDKRGTHPCSTSPNMWEGTKLANAPEAARVSHYNSEDGFACPDPINSSSFDGCILAFSASTDGIGSDIAT